MPDEQYEKEIYLIRHGETDLNKLGIVQGRGMDTDLNDTGRQQATAFFAAYKDVPFDKIYTSSLKRTTQTVQYFLDKGIPVERLPGLDEIGWGIWEGKASTHESMQAFKDLSSRWQAGDYTARSEGGESPAEAIVRLAGAMDLIISRKAEKIILVCMHGRAMRMLLCHMLGQPLSRMTDYPHQNTTLYKLGVNGNAFFLSESNNFKHLSALSE